MNQQNHPRSRLDFLKQILDLTNRMTPQKDNVDFLLQTIDQRQELMDEYDRRQKQGDFPPKTPEEKAQLQAVAREILELDKALATTLNAHKEEAKEQLSASNSQKKVLGYINQAISSSGSYMDYKK